MTHWKTKAMIAMAATAFAVAPLLSQTAPKAEAPPTEQSAAAPDGAAPVAGAPAVASHPAVVSPDAAKVVKKVSDAYSQLKSLDMAGKLSGDFDVAGKQEKQADDFTSSFASPNKFRHEIKDQALMGSTGEKFYVYAKPRNAYLTADAPKGKVMSDELPDPFAQLIGTQNLSLALALSKDPAAELSHSYGKIDKSADVKEGDTSYTVLSCSGPQQGAPQTTLLIDQKTNLIHKALIDMSPTLKAQGAPEVKKALVTIDYTTSKADAPVKPDEFAWAPPAGAKDARQMQQQDEGGGAATALEGKPAPDFKLKGLDDKEVSLASLKGKVVVLDFWATWCPPCVGSLPKLDKLYQDTKSQGVNIFAVNQAEDKAKVQDFMKQKGLSVPVLLDSDSKVGNAYQANAIPETVVIGKDGKVAKVFVGAGPDTEEQLRAAVASAQKAAH
jgi:peroxiredoxin/outer membrane lipoprotein-sorting protein